MEYIISLSTQTKGFLFSVGFGVIIGVLYDLLRIVRLCLTGKSFFVAVFDIVFAVSAAVLSFLFFLTVTDGEIRLYILFGEMLGFLIYYFSFGIIAVRFCEKTAEKIKKFFKKLFMFVFSPFIKFFKRIEEKINAFRKYLLEMSKKPIKNAKILLQKDFIMLYNLTDKMFKCRKKSPDNESDGDYGYKSKEKRK